MIIDRANLISELKTFALGGNGLVVGAPGIGKSYALAGLRETLKLEKIPHLILPVERLGSASHDDLKAVLRRDGDFINLLQEAVADANQPAILIIDGFDAARGETERAGVLKLIRRAISELAGQWNTIVSVRTFDAKKSRQLLELFSSDDSLAMCRQFTVPPLCSEELNQIFVQLPELQKLYNQGTKEFRSLLTIPFNLWLIENTLQGGAKTSEFSPVISEVQLLELYWDFRIRKHADSADKDYLLSEASRQMVESHNLTIRREGLYRPETRSAWEQLLSSEVLTQIEEPSIRIAFSHNILFDYAVSIYLLDSDPAKLADFIAKEPSRPLFLRPSLLYHFTRLWYFKREAFWQSFWGIVARQEIHLRQIVRLVLPAVVVNEARTLEDLKPLVEKLEARADIGIEAVAFLLQAVRFLQPGKTELWATFIECLANHLDSRFAWDASIVASGIVEAKDKNSEISIAACGNFGRSLLRWSWNSRKNENKRHWFERLAGLAAIPIVAKTYGTNPSESHLLIENILAIVGEPGFPIDCIYRLTNEVAQIIPYDPELVGLIYEKVFGYEENSREETHMGGIVMPLISNRRQDYEMCHYILIETFPAYLEKQPSSALRAGLKAMQAFAIQDHVLKYVKNGLTFEDLKQPFTWLGAEAYYVEDGSVIWDSTPYPDRELQVSDQIFAWFADAAKNNRSEDIDTFLGIFKSSVCLSFLWSRLLYVAANNAENLANRLWELAKAIPFYEQNDAIHAMGLFLEKASKFFSNEQRLEIENVILALPQTLGTAKREFAETRRNRFISAIPAECLIGYEAVQLRSVLEKECKIIPNEPLFKMMSSFKSFTEEDFLRDQGTQIEAAGNKALRDLYKPLADWSTKNKDRSQVESLVPNLIALRAALDSSDSDETVKMAAWNHLATFASDAVRQIESVESKAFPILRRVLLEAANNPRPVYHPSDAKWSHPSWSPAPRNDAAQALPWLTHFGEDKEVIAAIGKLTADSVPSVRFLLACELWRVFEHNPEVLWAMMNQFAERETNIAVLQGVTVSLWQLIRHDKTRSLELIAKLLQRSDVFSDEGEDEGKARGSLVCMVVDFAVDQNNSWAKQILASWQSNPIALSSILAVAGNRLIAHIIPGLEADLFGRARELLISHLDAVTTGLTELRTIKTLSPDIVQTKTSQLYRVIDETVMRIYFAADVDEKLSKKKEAPLTDESRKKYFFEVLPILDRVLEFGKKPEIGVLVAPTAHHFMQLLNGVLPYDPPRVLRMATDVVNASKKFNYNLDSMALREIVNLVESILADYRSQVQDDASTSSLLELLDAFAEVGWPGALNLVWRLDEIYR